MSNKMTAARRSDHRRLFLEGLESRAMLAGNVTASVSGGSLILRGDSLGNDVAVTWIAPNRYQVTGVGTTINGGAGFIASGVRNNIDIDLRGGDDTLTVTGSALPTGVDLGGSLLVRTQHGIDSATIADISVGGIIRVDTGYGGDTVDISNTFANDDILVLTFWGVDTVTATGVEANDLLLIDTGEQFDTIEVTGALAGHAIINSGNGNDRMTLTDLDLDRELIVRGLNGNDTLVADTIVAGRVDVDLGANNDALRATGLDVDGALRLVTFGGADSIAVETASANHIHIDAGTENDVVSLVDVTSNTDFNVFMGSGDDRLGVGGVINTGIHFRVDLGAGTDEATIDGGGGTIGRSLFLLGGDGADTVTAANFVVTLNIYAFSGEGNDDYTLDLMSADNLYAILAGGDDTLTASNLTIDDLFHADGGSGNDTYNDAGGNTAADFNIINFETTTP